MGDLGVFEADANAGKLSAEAAANQGFELEKSIDRAVFRAKEMFGAYLANSQSKEDFDERWAEVKPQAIRVIAEVTTPTPGVLRRVGAALRPSVPQTSKAQTKKTRPSSAKTAKQESPVVVDVPTVEIVREASTTKLAWAYDQATKLYTSSDPMQKFACPGCGHEQKSLGFSRCAGCERTWNSWPVRQHSSAKTGASTYVLMAREIKMRGDQFKMAAAGNVKEADAPWIPDVSERAELSENIKTALAADLGKVADAPMPQEPPPGMSQPGFGTMPGDNSGAMGSPVPAEQPPVPGGDADGDNDVAGGVTEGSPIDQIQDALQDAVVALKDVQMLSLNPQLVAMGSSRTKKVETLRTSMDRFWGLHKQMNYVAGMLAKEANEAMRSVDPRITGEAEFIKGYTAASKNEPLPPKTGRAYLEGYVAFHKQADTYSDGADYDRVFGPNPGDDKSPAARNDGTFLDGTGLVPANEIRDDAGPFDTSQPAQQESARQMDADVAAGSRDRGQGESSSIQPTGAKKALPKARG